jgi:hypothetical protein
MPAHPEEHQGSVRQRGGVGEVDHVHARLVAGGDQQAAATLDNFRLVGHSSLDSFGDYGDLFVHGNFAYVGSRCGEGAQGGDGVQVVDMSHPQHPRVVSTLPNPPFTRPRT